MVANGCEVGTREIAVYLALLNFNNRCGWKLKFKAVFGEMLAYTGIAKAETYYKALNQLQQLGLIEYHKGVNQYVAATFEIKVLYQKMEEHRGELW